MRITTRALCLLLLVMLFPVAALASAQDDEAAIRQTYERWRIAFEKKDETGVLVPVMAKGYIYTTHQGKRLEYEAWVDEALATMRVVKAAKVTVERVTVKGDVATAIVVWNLVVQIPDKQGKVHAFDIVERDQEEWERTPVGWKAYETHCLEYTPKRIDQ